MQLWVLMVPHPLALSHTNIMTQAVKSKVSVTKTHHNGVDAPLSPLPRRTLKTSSWLALDEELLRPLIVNLHLMTPAL